MEDLLSSFKNPRASFVDVRDVDEVAAIILHEKSNKHYNKVYNITGGQGLMVVTYLTFLKQYEANPIAYVFVTAQTAKTELIKAGFQSELVDYMLDFY